MVMTFDEYLSDGFWRLSTDYRQSLRIKDTQDEMVGLASRWELQEGQRKEQMSNEKKGHWLLFICRG